LEFVFAELARWRDDPDRAPEEAEERLNAQLCKYLNVAASHRFPMVLFSHEEKQTGTRRVDVAALPISGGFIGQTYHTIYDPFLVFEGKRLPAPSLSREREYVTGGTEKSGGIQRFKLALHGAQQKTAAIVGYVQTGDLEGWHSLINGWIRELASDTAAVDEKWSVDEQLADSYTASLGFDVELIKRRGSILPQDWLAFPPGRLLFGHLRGIYSKVVSEESIRTSSYELLSVSRFSRQMGIRPE
jgi:hypothetical protein